MSCRTVSESLPWLLNGSLGEDERRALRTHLETCECCRGELELSVEAWELLGHHVPSLALAEYAQGMTPGEIGRDRIERHLESCPFCREELSLATTRGTILAFGVARPTMNRRRRTERGRSRHPRAVALAASIAVVVGVAGLLWRVRGPAGAVDALRARGDARAVASAFEAAQPRSEPPAPASSAGAMWRDGFETGSTAGWSGSPENETAGRTLDGTWSEI